MTFSAAPRHRAAIYRAILLAPLAAMAVVLVILSLTGPR